MKIMILLISILIIIGVYSKDIDSIGIYLKENKIKETVELLRALNDNEKEGAVEILMAYKDKIAYGRFIYILNTLKNDKQYMFYLLSIKSEYIDDRIYSFLLNYLENNEVDKLIPFILKYDNCKIDYYKYAKAFYEKGILDNVIKRIKRKSLLEFYTNIVNYAYNSDEKSLNRILKYDNYRIKEMMLKGIFDNIQIEMLLSKMKTRSQFFIDIIVDFAIKNPQKDYSRYFYNTKYQNNYKVFRDVIKHNYIPRDLIFNDDIINNKLNLASYLFSAQFDAFNENYKYLEKSNLHLYFSILYALFNSNIERFNELISIYLISEKSYNMRMKIIQLQIMTHYIEDGTFFIYYIKGDKNNASLIARISGVYELFFNEEEDIKNMELIDENYSYIIINDIVNEKINKESIKSYMKNFPESIMRSILIFYEKNN